MRPRFERRPSVLERTGLKTTKFYDLIATEEFPAGIRQANSRTVVWLSSEVDEWIAKQAAGPRVTLKRKIRSPARQTETATPNSAHRPTDTDSIAAIKRRVKPARAGSIQAVADSK